MNANDLLRSARELMDRPSGPSAGLWPRATALLGRQALEAELDAIWARVAPGLERVSGLAQILCLPTYLEDRRLAERTAHVWSALSRACHHHAYDLAPTASELETTLSGVAELVSAIDQNQR